ncbi:hypothetical protein DID78_01485 [Candidatus Marinamargulisbacteria bacterium SCGC AG-343-D04]|nr:hypothetical protein DID78_01485 [Candidatus Marinamargulisbacteria bacterium SCGC AG-343-D04]
MTRAYISLYIILVSVTTVFAQPNITLISPINDYKSPKELILFKGRVSNAEKLTINGQSIPLHKNRFYIKAKLNPHQKNTFTLIASNKENESTSITKHIDFFPQSTPKTPPLYSIEDIIFDPLKNQWKIKGTAHALKNLSINATEVPIKNNEPFHFWIQNNRKTTHSSSISISGISKTLHLFSHQLGLYETELLPEHKKDNLSAKIPYKKFEKGIIKSFYQKKWRQIPLSTIQEKMITQLISIEENGLQVKHINLMKYNNSVIAIIPLLNKNIDIESTSYQLALILQNTVSKSKSITLMWYNAFPSFLEIIYTPPIEQSLSNYWIIDDFITNRDYAYESKTLEIFNSYSFEEKVQ